MHTQYLTKIDMIDKKLCLTKIKALRLDLSYHTDEKFCMQVETCTAFFLF